MNALQQWYDYVDSVSRPANQAPDEEAPAAFAPPAPGAAPRPVVVDNTIDLGPRFRARQFLAGLTLPAMPSEGEWRLPAIEAEPPLPELRFDPEPAATPTFRDYVPETPRDPVA